MDIIELYRDYHLPHATEGHKHCRPGWVNTPCPFCTGNEGYHLGATLDGAHFFCWRCGWHPQVGALVGVLNLPVPKVLEIIKQYGGSYVQSHTENKAPTIGGKVHKYPSGIIPLLDNYKKYLRGRGFDPDKLEREWGLLATGPVSQLDKIDYKLRIVIPINWDGQRVSFQARQIKKVTKHEDVKYKACPIEREIIHHKHILYGHQKHWQKTGICVEGVTDVWRFGANSFATFGIQYKRQQVRQMAKHFTRIAVAFDDEDQAQEQAQKLVDELLFCGVDAFRVPIVGDPGAMKQDDADHLVKQIMRKIYIL